MNLESGDFWVDTAAGLLHASWQAGVLALVVLTVGLACGRRLDPRFRFGLWLAVFVRLALPVVPAAPWSMFGWFSPEPLRVVLDVGSPDSTVTKPATAARSTQTIAAGNSALGPAESSADLMSGAVRETGWSVSARGIAVSIWLLGAAILLLRLLLGVISLHHARRRWTVPTDPALLAMFGDCRRQLGIRRRVTLWVSPDRLGPATLGCFRSLVVLPCELVESLPAGDLRLILLHELTHVCRHDVLVDRLACIVTAIHWPNPLAWMALVGLRRSRELACDVALLDRVGNGAARDYGRLILGTIEMLSTGNFQSAAVGIFGRATSGALRQRISLIAGYRQPSRPLAIAAGALVLCVACVGLTDAQTPGAAEREKLLADRAATARQQFMAVSAAFEAETVTLDLLLDSAEQLVGAELAAANTAEVRLAARQRHLAAVRKIADKVTGLFNVGARGGEAEKYYEARFLRQNAEIALIREQLGLPPEKDEPIHRSHAAADR